MYETLSMDVNDIICQASQTKVREVHVQLSSKNNSAESKLSGTNLELKYFGKFKEMCRNALG
jgi:hypothetical protein